MLLRHASRKSPKVYLAPSYGKSSKPTPPKYKPPKGHVRCKKKNCHACADLDLTEVHEETEPRKPFEWEGDEASLAETYGKK